MKNISNEIKTHRTAIAQAIVRLSRNEAITSATYKKLASGDAFEASRVAGILAIKKTSETIPGCHPLPIEYASVTHRVAGLDVVIEVEVQTVYKTGVAMEAMYGASVAALTLLEMLRPVDEDAEIAGIRIIIEKGGSNLYNDKPVKSVKTAVVVCSDSIAAGTKEDFAGKAIISRLQDHGVNTDDYRIIPDEADIIRKTAQQHCNDHYDLVIFTGGTGLSDRDITPEAIRPMLDREIPGIAEAIRAFGQERMPYAMLSRSVAGLKGHTMILALPGSTRGAEESMDAIFPYLLHHFRVMEHPPHD